MMKRALFTMMAVIAMLLPVGAQDSIFVQMKDGTVLAYGLAENDTVSVDEIYMNICDTTFYSGLVNRIVFDRNMLAKKSGMQLMSFKLRHTDEGNEALLDKTFSADIDELMNNDTISFVIPYLTNYKLKPFFVASSQNIKVYANDELITSEESVVDFSSPVRIRLEYGSREPREYVVCLKNSGLPIVVIETPDRQGINSRSRWVEKSTMHIYNADGTVNYASGNNYMNISGRGNSTWSYNKKPYNIKLNVKSAILGMPKHKRWCLLANYIDRTLMRNAVAFELARMTSMDWTPNGRFVELVVNGKALGNYYLCEAIRIDDDRVNINEMKPTDISGEAITGGYLMELDSYYDAEWKFKTTYFRMPVNIKEPDEDVINSYQFSYIKSYCNEAERRLNNGSFEEFAEYFDMNTLVDWYLLNEVIYNPELNHPKSSYMHKDKNGKLRMGPAWDHDWETFTPHSSLKNRNAMWFGKLFTMPEFIQLLKERWNKLKKPFASVKGFIEETREGIRLSWEFNNSVWPTISNSVNGDTTLPFDDAVDRLKNSFLNRLNALDVVINSL